MKYQLKKSVAVISALGLSILVSACGNQYKKDAVQQLLTAHTGDTYTVVKNEANIGGWMVFKDDRTGEFLAVNYGPYQKGMTYDQWIQAAGGESNVYSHNLKMVDNSHYETESLPYTNPDGSIYYQYQTVWVTEIDYEGNGYVFEDGAPHLKDLETLGANLQASQTAELRKSFMSQYGLSADRAQEVASLVSNWSSLSKKREMTSSDLKDFSTAILGADLATFQRAYDKSVKQGDSKDIDNLVKVAARTNGISVEHARAILKTFLN